MDMSRMREKLLSALYRRSSWFLRNARRAFTLLAWLCTGQFTRAGQALLPCCRSFVPMRIQTMIPYRLRAALRRRFEAAPPSTRSQPQSQAASIDYSEWIARNDTLSDHDRILIRDHIASFKNRPKISMVMLVYNTRTEYLQQAIDSVVGQLYQDWELHIVHNGPTSRDIGAVVRNYSQKDVRIRPHSLSPNGGVCAAINTALEMATRDWIILMDPDDLLSEHALYLVAEAANSQPDAAILYSDHDHITATGQRVDPYFKPDWDYDLFLGQNYINPLCAYRGELVHRVGGIREGFGGAQYWDFAFRILEAAPDAKVHHLPFILYHRRVKDVTSPQPSTASAAAAAKRVVNEHFRRTGRAAVALPLGHAIHLRTKWELPKKRPLVSIIIPTKDQCKLLQTCIDGLLNRTDYRPLDIVIVDNGSSEPDALAFLARIQSKADVNVVHDPRPFNFSRLVNLGVAASSGEICVLLNNDVDIINPDWLDEMVSHALRPEVGAVGAKLYYPNDTLQHGGVILGVYHVAGSIAGHAHRLLPRESRGYFSRLNLTHSLSCVTAACLATRRELYDRVFGFNEQDLAISFNDVDFCLRVRQAGYKVIWTPNAELYHYEYVSRGNPGSTPEGAARNKSERSYIRKLWGPLLDNDPYYNPNLSITLPCFEPAPRSRVRKPWSTVGSLANRSTHLNAGRSAARSPHSWRITRPIRAAANAVRVDWFLRNTRRAFLLLELLCTGQFSRAGSALLPYYRRLIPVRIQTMVPYRLQDSVARWLEKESALTRPQVADREREYRAAWLHETLANSSVVRIPGAKLRNPHSPTILVCAHAISRFLYGAERSFLDLLEGFAENAYNVIVVIPNTRNLAYVHEITTRSAEVVSFHYGWWRAGTPIDESLVAVFEELVDLHGVNAVHANTIMLREPLLAARRRRVPAVVHAREIITGDPTLSDWIGADADRIVKEVIANADYIIANSKATAECYDQSKSVMVVPNMVDVEQMDLANDVDPAEIRFALVSSNLPKKGLGDVIELAKRCESSVPNARFLIIGPDNQYVSALRKEQQKGKVPSNVDFPGYRDTPRDAMAEANVVLSVSHFKESFGRTVIEAMAARRPVIAYDWGGPSELIRDGETGFLVDFRNIDQLLARVRMLCKDARLISQMGSRGRVFVSHHYSAERFAESLKDVYSTILCESLSQ